MPAYDFRCTKCEDVFEVVRPAGAASPVACPVCGAETKRIFTPVGVVFKGSGFHSTDYRKTPKSTEAAPPQPCCPGSKDAVSDNAGESTPCASCPSSSD